MYVHRFLNARSDQYVWYCNPKTGLGLDRQSEKIERISQYLLAGSQRCANKAQLHTIPRFSDDGRDACQIRVSCSRREKRYFLTLTQFTHTHGFVLSPRVRFHTFSPHNCFSLAQARAHMNFFMLAIILTLLRLVEWYISTLSAIPRFRAHTFTNVNSTGHIYLNAIDICGRYRKFYDSMSL